MATLGGKAQLITLALDCLREMGVTPEKTIVFHTNKQRTETAQAIERLKGDAAQIPDSPPYHFLELRDLHGPLKDVTAPDEMETAFHAIYNEVRTAKFEGRIVHLLVAGGRRTLGVFGMAVAQMLFDDSDRLWHLASHPALEESANLHASPDEWVRLIGIPVLAWGRLSPVFAFLKQVDDPFDAFRKMNELRINEQWDSARIFILSKLSPAETSVIELLVRDGMSQAEIAEHAHLSPRTVEQHLRSAYRKAAEHWDLEDVNQTQLVRLLGLYLSTQRNETDYGKSRMTSA